MSSAAPDSASSGPAWLRPAPDSLVGRALQRGRPVWAEFVHLAWTIWVFIVPVFTPQGYDARWWLLTALSYPLFVGLYCGVMLLPVRWMHAGALGMVALCLLLVPWYPSGMSYFVFGCIFLGHGRWRGWWGYPLALLAVNLLFVATTRYFGYPWTAMVWMPVTTLATGMVVQLQRSLECKDQALLLSQEEVRRLAATAERERIGRDLHDLLGHTLSLVALKADLAGKLLSREPDAARREIDELGEVARQALAEVRRAVTGMRAVRFTAELAAAKVLLQGHGTALELAGSDPAALPPELETVLALCLREALTNVHRHARARRVQVLLELDEAGCRLQVEDDGRGGALRPGNGLAGMRERLQLLGGQLRLEPALPRGTRLVAELPPAGRTPAAQRKAAVAAGAVRQGAG